MVKFGEEEIKVESDIPIPKLRMKHKAGRPSKYNWKKMKVGDSICATKDLSSYERQKAIKAVNRFVEYNKLEWEFTWAIVFDDEKHPEKGKHFRIWRTK